MSWSIQHVAQMSGVTARTLRYYDEIGLLRPARIGANGYRYYERSQLLRLQQILLLRELGLDLATIGAVVDDQADPIDALRRHHQRLLDERSRLDRLVTTVAATITHLEEGTDMPAEDLFDGFEMSPEYLAEVEARRVQTTGTRDQPELAEIKDNTAHWSRQDWQTFNDEGAELVRRMLALLRDGVPADDPATFAVLDEDLTLQRKLWNPGRDSYLEQAAGLAQPSDLRSYYNADDPRLADYVREAMLAYADTDAFREHR